MKRTLYSKYSLQVAPVASRDARDVALHRVHLAKDGSAVASNGRALLAVGPPLPAKADTFPDVDEDRAEAPDEGVGLTLEDVMKLRRNFPGDKHPSLQYAQLTRCSPKERPTRVELMTTDGKTRQKVAGIPARGTFPKWRKVLADARSKTKKARFCVDRQSLMQVLAAMDKACPDRGGYNPVFVEIGEEDDAIVLRSHNYESGQTALAMVNPLRAPGWLEESEWERSIHESNAAKSKAKRVRARRAKR